MIHLLLFCQAKSYIRFFHHHCTCHPDEHGSESHDHHHQHHSVCCDCCLLCSLCTSHQQSKPEGKLKENNCHGDGTPETISELHKIIDEHQHCHSYSRSGFCCVSKAICQDRDIWDRLYGHWCGLLCCQ